MIGFTTMKSGMKDFVIWNNTHIAELQTFAMQEKLGVQWGTEGYGHDYFLIQKLFIIQKLQTNSTAILCLSYWRGLRNLKTMDSISYYFTTAKDPQGREPIKSSNIGMIVISLIQCFIS